MQRIPIKMPQLGESIAEAIVVSIDVEMKSDVVADQEVFQVETNKATMGVCVPCGGKLIEVVAELDKSYPVGAVLGYLEVSDEEAAEAGLSEEPPAPESSEPAKAEEESKTESRDDSLDGIHFKVNSEMDIQSDSEEENRSGVVPTVRLPVPANAAGASYLSPRLKARMQEFGFNASDLAGVAGSGAGGRVTIEDFEKYIRDIDNQKTTTASPMRIAVADSMRRSWSRPIATVGRTLLLDRMLIHRKASDPKPGPALYIIRALAIALAENTAVAGRLVGNRIVHPKAIDIGFAVEAEDGVLVPVIRDVDQKRLGKLVELYAELVGQAKARRLPPDAIGTGIATVTNFGTFGLVWATPIPLPEQNLVFGLGAGRKVPVWSDEVGQFVPATEAEITLSFDHRVLDGGAAGRLLARVAELLQKPDEL